MNTLPIPVNADGQYDVRAGVPAGLVHIEGKRLTITCRRIGIAHAAAIVGEGSKRFGPKLDGVVIYAEDVDRLQSAIAERDEARPSEERKQATRAAKQAKETLAMETLIRDIFPGMPLEEARQCAAHASEIGSGRVGRSSRAGGEIKRAQKAVVAHVRHQHTDYDQLLAEGTEREAGRTKVFDAVRYKVEAWSNGTVRIRPEKR